MKKGKGIPKAAAKNAKKKDDASRSNISKYSSAKPFQVPGYKSSYERQEMDLLGSAPEDRVLMKILDFEGERANFTKIDYHLEAMVRDAKKVYGNSLRSHLHEGVGIAVKNAVQETKEFIRGNKSK